MGSLMRGRLMAMPMSSGIRCATHITSFIKLGMMIRRKWTQLSSEWNLDGCFQLLMTRATS